MQTRRKTIDWLIIFSIKKNCSLLLSTGSLIMLTWRWQSRKMEKISSILAYRNYNRNVSNSGNPATVLPLWTTGTQVGEFPLFLCYYFHYDYEDDSLLLLALNVFICAYGRTVDALCRPSSNEHLFVWCFSTNRIQRWSAQHTIFCVNFEKILFNAGSSFISSVCAHRQTHMFWFLVDAIQNESVCVVITIIDSLLFSFLFACLLRTQLCVLLTRSQTLRSMLCVLNQCSQCMVKDISRLW